MGTSENGLVTKTLLVAWLFGCICIITAYNVKDENLRDAKSGLGKRFSGQCVDDSYIGLNEDIVLTFQYSYDITRCTTIIDSGLGQTLVVVFEHFYTASASQYFTFEPAIEALGDTESSDSDYYYDWYGSGSGSGSGYSSGDGSGDGDGDNTQRYFGNYGSDYTLVFKTDSLAIHYVNDGAMASPDVVLRVYSVQAISCGVDVPDLLQAGDRVILESPHYPQYYEASLHCSTRIVADTGLWLHLQFLDFDLECYCCDSFTIENPTSGSGVGYTCDTLPESSTLESNVATFRFQSDGGLGGKGYRLLVTVVDIPSNVEYVVLAPWEERMITSPNYPQTYDSDTEVTTVVTVEGDVTLHFQVIVFNLECCCDHLIINGEFVTCSDIPTEETIPDSNQLEIIFTSDSSLTLGGFSMRVWTEGDTDEPTDECILLGLGDETTITSPNYPSEYDNNVDTTTCVTIEGGVELNLYYQITDIEMECCCDHLSINGFAVECSTMAYVETQVFSKNVTATFVSDGSVTSKGFSMRVWTTATTPTPGPTDTCGQRIVLSPGEEQTITSPNYPDDYDSYSDITTCVAVEGDFDGNLLYQIIDFSVECCCDHLSINGNPVVCGEVSYEENEVPANEVTVSFTSDGSFADTGFSMRVWAAATTPTYNCDLRIVLSPGEEQTITSPNYPDDYDSYSDVTTCVAVEGDFEGNLLYQIINFSVECCCDHLSINGNPVVCGEVSYEENEVPAKEFTVSFTSDGSFADTGFSMRVWAAATAPTSTCDQQIVLSPGEEQTVTSPNYPGNYDSYSDITICVAVEGGVAENLYYQINDFAVECCCDHLSINGNAVVCGEVSYGETEVPSKEMTVSFSSDGSFTDSGFSMRVWAAGTPSTYICDQRIVLSLGEEHTITSPNYPDDYDSYSDITTCVALEDDVEGNIFYQITDFEVECCCDHLSINGKELDCDEITYDHMSSDEIEAPSNDLRVTFTSDASYTYKGFNLRVWVPVHVTTPGPMNTCDQRIVLSSGEEQTITSPNYPDNYDSPSDITICVAVEGDVGGNLYYQIIDFAVECCCDYLSINGNVIACGETPDGEIEVPSNDLTVIFKSDGSVSYKGFNLRVWQAVPVTTPDPTDTCDQRIVLSPGEVQTITSPNYPDNYDSYSDITTCVAVEGDVGGNLHYQIIDFAVECCCDFLSINGNAVACGETPDGEIEVPSNELTVTFTSDSSVVETGFNLRVWRAVPVTTPGPTDTCDQRIVLSPGEVQTITSPNFPDNYDSYSDITTCVAVEGDVGGNLYYQIVDFAVECCCDYLSINGDAIVCGETPDGEIEVPSNELTVTFTSDSSVVETGFNLRVWRAVHVTTPGPTDTCDQRIVLSPGEEQTITSPNYPDNYDSYSDITTCVAVEGDVGGNLYYQITDFAVECCCDYLSINGDAVVCDETPDGEIEVPSNELTVTFTSDSSVVETGFSLRVMLAAPVASGTCGQDYKLEDGESLIIGSPNYPSDYTPNVDCITKVTTMAGTVISVQFLVYDLECCCDFVTINKVQQACEDYYQTKTELSSNRLELSFTSDSTYQMSGFLLQVWAEATDEVTIDQALASALAQFGLTVCQDHGTIGIQCLESPNMCATSDMICNGRQDCTWSRPFNFGDEDSELCDEEAPNTISKRSDDHGEEVVLKVLTFLQNHTE
ncbi:cubilin-like isoform X2 [Glandiceps talaboti]